MIVHQTPKFLIGIDEVGRGPIAGPVSVCALMWKDRDVDLPPHIKDSKKLSPQKRNEWFEKINTWQREGKLLYVVSSVSAEEIDSIGISPAIKKALCASLEALEVDPEQVRIVLDGGLYAPREYRFQETIIGGDAKESIIALASIAAKVTRDAYMETLGDTYPVYGFLENKGYGTATHYQALKKHGLSAYHRKHF